MMEINSNKIAHASRLAKLAYEKGNKIEGLMQPPFKFIKQFSVKPDVQGYICRWGDRGTAFVFRGSDSGVDWAYNLKFAMNNGIHRGFLMYADKAWKAIEKHLADDLNIFIGHSLGGAVATILASWAAQDPSKGVECITFGSPRVGCKSFVDFFNSEIYSSWRMVFETDLVPKVPPAHFGYKHVSGKVLLTDKGTMTPVRRNALGNALYRGFNLIKNVAYVIPVYSAWKLRKSIKDHDIKKYVKALERWI